MTDMRQRPDGTFTYTTPEWDARWYWPAGTKIEVSGVRGGGTDALTGVVTKENLTTVWVKFDNGRPDCKVAKLALIRR